MKHLVIISHTEHYINSEGIIVGWGSTITEINHLCDVFDTITHVAMLHSEAAPPSALPYVSDKIKFVALPAVGGSGFKNKLKIVAHRPKIIGVIRNQLKNADYFQFRAPTGIGVFVIPYLILMPRKKGWFKYAGNWNQSNAPLAYSFQKWLLEHQSRKVTINGFWDDQPKQCLSFENPCLTEEELVEGHTIIKEKRFEFPINLCFVGRLESAKGIDLIIDAIGSLDITEKQKIGVIHLVGDGAKMGYYKSKVSSVEVTFVFHGFLSRTEVHRIYKECHAIVLPTANEGFPKVIAEAMNYGCIPIVSDVSSISHYIKEGSNGFLLRHLTSGDLQKSITRFLNLTEEEFVTMISGHTNFIRPFTYKHYNNRLRRDILALFSG